MINLAVWASWFLCVDDVQLRGLSANMVLQIAFPALWIGLFFLLIFAVIGLYAQINLFGGTKEYGLVFQGCSYGMVVLVLGSYFYQGQLNLSRWLLLSWGLGFVLTILARFFVRRLLFTMRRSGAWFVQKTLLVGVSEHSIMIARQFIEQTSGVDMIGFLDEFMPVGSRVIQDLHVIGTPEDIQRIARDNQIQQVILFSDAVAWETFSEVLSEASAKSGFELHLSPGYYGILSSGVRVTHQALVPLLKVEPTRIQGWDRVVKMIVDYVLGLLLFLISIPVMVLLILFKIFLDGRPIFTSHQIVGLNGEIFSARKFHTGLQASLRRRLDDPELMTEIASLTSESHLGRFLFQTGLDKLPQLWMVLRGKMSLVGPRASAPGNEFFDRTEFHPSLLTVKPGWTGPWAVWGAYTPADEKRLNLYYIRNWTIWADLQILFQTFKLVITRR